MPVCLGALALEVSAGPVADSTVDVGPDKTLGDELHRRAYTGVRQVVNLKENLSAKRREANIRGDLKRCRRE